MIKIEQLNDKFKPDYLNKELIKFLESWNIARTLDGKQKLVMYRSFTKGKWETMLHLHTDEIIFHNFEGSSLYSFRISISENNEYSLEVNLLRMQKRDLNEFYDKVIWDEKIPMKVSAKFKNLEDLYQCFIALDNNV